MPKPIPVQKFQLHHERANTREYSDSDARVHHEVCQHTRFRDKDFPALTQGVCMDCGATITLGTWQVVPNVEHLDDASLVSERARYNLLQRGFEVMPPRGGPDKAT